MKKDTIQFEDLMKVDIRVGKVLSAKPLPKSDKLIELKVDLGEDYGTRTILAGIAKFYAPEQLLGRNLLFLPNLEPKKMAGSVSEGMMLAVDGQEKPELLAVNPELAPGSTVR